MNRDSPRAFESNPIPDDRYAQYWAFRLMGLVRMDVLPGLTQLQWDVARAEPRALTAATDYFETFDADCIAAPIALRLYFGGWLEEFCETPSQAIDRIRQSQAYRNALPLSRPTQRRMPLEAVVTSHWRIRRAFESWREAAPETLLDRLERESLLDHVLLLARHPEHGQFVYHHIGRRSMLSQVYGRSVAHRLHGRIFAGDKRHQNEFQPAVSAYRDVAENGLPRFDHVINRFKPPGDERRWVSYERLLFNVHDEDGRRLLVVHCEPRRQVSVRLMGAAFA